MNKIFNIFLGCSFFSLILTADITIPRITPPVLDGEVSAAEYQGAYSGNLVELRSGKKPGHATKYFLGCDEKNLYIAFICDETAPEKMRRIHTHSEERDTDIYNDDCVEIFFNPFCVQGSGNFHFAVNSCGLIYDAVKGDVSFDSGIKVASKVAHPGWSTEIAIPFADLGVIPGGAEIFKLNLGRERQIGNKEFSTMKAGEGGFHSLTRFTDFRPVPQRTRKALPPVTFYSFGSLAEPLLVFSNTDPRDKNSYRVKVETLDAQHKTVRSFNLKSRPGKTVKFEYRMQGSKNAVALRYTILPESGKGEAIYSNVFTFPASSAGKSLAMMVEKPQFNSLFGTEKKRDFGVSGLQWTFGTGVDGYMNIFTRQVAMPYSGVEAARQYKLAGTAMLVNSTMIGFANKNARCLQFGTPLVVMPRGERVEYPAGLFYNLYIVPSVKKVYLEKTRFLAGQPNVKMLIFGDEMAEYCEESLITYYKKLPDHPELKALDERIKKEYGNGKYGIPSSIEEKDPLAWIAYRRFINDELVNLYREAAKIAKEVNPDIIVVSDDPVGNQSKLYSFHEWKEFCDIVTHQLYPRNNQNIDSFGFLTRYLRDLSGVENVWPVPHVEEYGASFTPLEVLCKLSAAIRNGATGFNFYFDDSPGRRSKKRYMIHEIYGAPDRYTTCIEAMKLIAKMPELNFPEADCAVFTSIDSLRGQSGLMLRQPPLNDMYLHGFLGYGAGVWYKFINEHTMKDLKKFKFIATVESEYVSEETFKALQDYVADGGVLLLVNANAFRSTPEGRDLTGERAKFTGINKVSENTANLRAIAYQNWQLPVGRSFILSVSANAKVTAKLDNGMPGIVEHRFGKGKVVTLATNPCGVKTAGNQGWAKFFTDFANECKAETRCDMWNFELPRTIIPKVQNFPGSCITNNFVYWQSYKPLRPNNSDCTGSYTLSPAPNVGKDVSTGENAFGTGKLTDRPKAVVGLSAAENKSSWTDWAIGWKTAEPITISCKWNKEKPVNCVKLFIDGFWRDAKITVNGKEYTFPCPENFNSDLLSMRVVTMTLPEAVNCRDLTITIDGNKEFLCIAEMEIWSEK
ncbi:MAG: hypothetical protein E7050_11355 [Lentisphaerae bacterium]|nr:hypothetical protein [Lentisphaerota bacterium]